MTARMDRIMWHLKQERQEIWYIRIKETRGYLTT